MMEKQQFQILLELRTYRKLTLTLACDMQQQAHFTNFFHSYLPPPMTCQGVIIKQVEEHQQQRKQLVLGYKTHGPYHHQLCR